MAQVNAIDMDKFRERYAVILRKVTSAIEAINYILRPEAKMVATEQDMMLYRSELEQQVLNSLALVKIPVHINPSQLTENQRTHFLTVLLPCWDQFLKVVYDSANNVLEHYELLRNSKLGVSHG